jgi:hypothetical protein
MPYHTIKQDADSNANPAGFANPGEQEPWLPTASRIFVPDGDPEGVRIIDRMASTGLAITFPRVQWSNIRTRPEFERAGIYVLSGYATEDADLPTLYIGQGDRVLDRIDSHYASKDFWDRGFAFITKSSNSGFNRAHITWLEHMLVARARRAGRSHLNNGNIPAEPTLSEADKADTHLFLREILQVLPIVGLRAFEIPVPVATPNASGGITPTVPKMSDEPDTVIVPAQKEGFDDVFIGQNAWWAIRHKLIQPIPLRARQYGEIAVIYPHRRGNGFRPQLPAKKPGAACGAQRDLPCSPFGPGTEPDDRLRICRRDR